MSVTYRYLRPDELSAAGRLVTHSFPSLSRPAEWWAEQLGDPIYGGGTEVIWAGEEDGRIVAICQLHRLHQWIGGAEFPVMGLATVSIAPTHRRMGIAADLVESGLRAARERGDVASALFPFRSSFYRKLGFGLAGEVHQYRVPPAAFPASDDRGGVRMLESHADLVELREFYRHWAATQTGQMARSDRVWDHLLAAPDRATAIIRDDAGVVSGYALLSYRADLRPTERYLDVEEIAWIDAAARCRSLAWLSSLGDQWREIVLRVLPDQELEDLLKEPRLPAGSAPGWGFWFPSATLLRGHMFRILDLAAAWQLRSVQPGPGIALALDVRDPQIQENAGLWHVRLEGGRAEARPAESDAGADLAMRIDIETLSRIFIGSLTPSAAVRAGLLTVTRGDDRVLDLDRALALPRCWTFDRF